MKIVENKRRRLRHYIGAPIRFLRKARDLYVDRMVSFDGRVGNANVVLCPGTNVSHIQYLPHNFGRYTTKKMDGRDDENLRDLYRSISSKYHWNRTDLNQAHRHQVMMDRSYSVAVGKIGTIDEEEPCDFHEEVAMQNESVFARCRSHAVTRKNGFYY